MDSKRRNRRRFLQSGAALAGLTVTGVRSALGQSSMAEAMSPKNKELIAYGERSKYIKSIRVPVSGRMSPDMYGLTFHVLTPLQDQFGIITPSSLFYVATHRGRSAGDQSQRTSLDDPRHGRRPLVFTMDELKRLPLSTASISSSAWATAHHRNTRPFRRPTG